MNRVQTLCAAVPVLILLLAACLDAQIAPESTRFTITGAPVLSLPAGEFRSNVGNGFGAVGAFLYHLDRPGIFSLRFDVSGVEYGREKKEVPISPTIGERVLVDVTTTNSIIGLSFGPELAVPRGAFRPYVNTGFSELFFRTSSGVHGTSSGETFASTTNFSDATAAWFLGGGARIPLAGNNPRKAISLDVGVRYYRGGTASYLREGSIQDNPDGSISFTPLSSRTPHVVYLIGVRFRIPHDPSVSCNRFLC